MNAIRGVVILDTGPPRMDGYDWASALREDRNVSSMGTPFETRRRANDRFNGPQRIEPAAEPRARMSPESALDYVEGSELACPECGVSEWS